LETCRQPEGGYGGQKGHDANLQFTLSAIQLYILFNRLEEIDVVKNSAFILKLQNSDGSFSSDIWGEKDVKFTYMGLLSLKLLQKLNTCDIASAQSFLLSCLNKDGGFGLLPRTESHAGFS
jgi:geranylgeranyl transferase type-2 subunit beta